MDSQMERPSGLSLGPDEAAPAIGSCFPCPRMVPAPSMLIAYSSWAPSGLSRAGFQSGGQKGRNTSKAAPNTNIFRPKCKLFSPVCQENTQATSICRALQKAQQGDRCVSNTALVTTLIVRTQSMCPGLYCLQSTATITFLLDSHRKCSSTHMTSTSID